MAIVNCRQCKKMFSNMADACPHCGAKAKKGHPIIMGLLFVGAAIYLLSQIGGSDAPTSSTKLDPHAVALSQTGLKFDWTTSGSGNVMMLSGEVKNNNGLTIKDIEIRCLHTAKSGTKIVENRKTIFETLQPNGALIIKEFNMGLIHTDVASASCELTNLVIVE